MVAGVEPLLPAYLGRQRWFAGEEPVAVDGQLLPATRLVLALPDGSRDVWVDSRGRLLKVALPSQGITAVRDERPR